MITREQVYHEWLRHGNVGLTAQFLGSTPSVVRSKVVAHLKQLGEPTDALSAQHQVKVIDQHSQYSFRRLRQMVGNPAYAFGVGVYHIGDQLVFSKVDKHPDEKLVGVYTCDSSSEDTRDDLYWYIVNEMGVKP